LFTGKEMNPVFIIAILILIGANGFLIFKTVKTWLNYSASQHWIETKSRIDNIERQRVSVSEGSGMPASTTSYELYVTYRYKAAGQIFTRELIKTVYSEKEADAIQVGDVSTIYVDPTQPDQAWEERGNVIDIFGVLAALIAANLIGAGILYQINSFFSSELS